MRPDEALAKTRATSQLSQRTRAKIGMIAARDGWSCAYGCGRVLDFDTAVLEHVIPKSRGGRDGIVNRVLSCPFCDREKKDRTPAEWQPGKVWGHPILDGQMQPIGVPADVRKQVRRGKVSKLNFVPFTNLRWCCTCQKPVVLTDLHPAGHLLIKDPSKEPRD